MARLVSAEATPRLDRATVLSPLFFDKLAGKLLDPAENAFRDEIHRPELDIRGGVLSLEFDTDEDVASFFDSSMIFRSDRRRMVVSPVDVVCNGGQALWTGSR